MLPAYHQQFRDDSPNQKIKFSPCEPVIHTYATSPHTHTGNILSRVGKRDVRLTMNRE